MSNVPGVIPSAAAEVPLTPAKRTRLEYSTVAKTSTTRCKPMQQVVDAACTTVPGVIPSAAAGVPYHSAKRTRLEYSTVAKTGLIDPA
ncbi:hypothetical protein BB561_003989, partial [Smittium simulii]